MHASRSGTLFDTTGRATRAPTIPAPTPPLTHHEILGLIEPFARRGLRVDLARSDRGKRDLVFTPITHGDEADVLAGLVEAWRLDNSTPDSFRLTRTLTLPTGLTATLRADGPDPGALLSCIDSLAPSRQFRSQRGVVIALSYHAAPTQMNLTHAEAGIDGLAVRFRVATRGWSSAEIELVPPPGTTFEFPDDLLAVLGGGWGLLRRTRAGWKSEVTGAGGGRDRTRDLEPMVERMVAHLAATLAQPPDRFHEALMRARWRVALKRATPMIIYVALLAGAGGLSFVRIPQGSFLPNLIWSIPSLLMFAAFVVPNRPRLEVPPLPRRLSPTAWRPLAIAGLDGSRQPAN